MMYSVKLSKDCLKLERRFMGNITDLKNVDTNTIQFLSDKDVFKLSKQLEKDATIPNHYEKAMLCATRCFQITKSEGLKHNAANMVLSLIGKKGLRNNIPSEIIRYYEQGALLLNNHYVYSNLAYIYYNQGKYDQAISWYEKAAKMGNDFSQCMLGKIYQTGPNNFVDYSKAFYWFTLATRKVNKVAWQCLGDMYNFGQHVQENLVTALNCYEKAVALGNESALVDCQQVKNKIEQRLYGNKTDLERKEKSDY